MGIKAVKRHKILIIEDDRDFVASIKRILEGRYQTIHACTGREGWKRLRQEQPDLVILGVLINKRGEGLIFGRQLREDSDFRNTPVITLTGIWRQAGSFPAKGDSRGRHSRKIDMYMEKPISPSQLLTKVADLLRTRDSLEQPPPRHEPKDQAHNIILCVEPDRKTAAAYTRMFRAEGYDVEAAVTLKDAVSRIKQVKFDCIVMDVDLPDMAGYDAVPVIKSIEPDVNIVMTVDRNTKDLEARVRKEDILYYYIKSFGSEELKLAVRSALATAHRRDLAP